MLAICIELGIVYIVDLFFGSNVKYHGIVDPSFFLTIVVVFVVLVRA